VSAGADPFDTPSRRSETATEFMPLLRREIPASLDSSQLVRVELPGSALIAVGPVIRKRRTPRSKPTLLGHDGWRAIRFVH
jgi:hypothetical protein